MHGDRWPKVSAHKEGFDVYQKSQLWTYLYYLTKKAICNLSVTVLKVHISLNRETNQDQIYLKNQFL